MIITNIDWIVIIIYLFSLILLSAYISREQKSKEDYFIAKRTLGPFKLSVSVIATQCSTNSIIGAPAFIAFASGGGLVWLQYELAIPLAMIFIMIFIFHIFYKLRLISVYEYLESRFDKKTRLLLSSLFQFIRVFATAVTVYSFSIIIELITGLNIIYSVLILGLCTIIYDILGGIKAIIYSDILQMTILITILLGTFIFMLDSFDGFSNLINSFPDDRLKSFNFSNHGLGDNETFAFLPMLLGGFFLYVSYYGCDQSQVQRELSARNQDEGQKIFLYNSLMRFPLVLLYCLIGIGISVYAIQNPDFLNKIPHNNGSTNYNLALPVYLIEQLPTGILGLALVALFAAAMSSIDSVLNSLSAVTMEDFLKNLNKNKPWSADKELFYSRICTLFWGLIAIILSFYVDDIASTVLEAINKIGSLINGPILGVFLLGLFTYRVNGNGACIGLLVGFLLNIVLWIFFPSVSWLWWNVFGFIATYHTGIVHSYIISRNNSYNESNIWSIYKFRFKFTWIKRYIILLLWFVFIFLICLAFNYY